MIPFYFVFCFLLFLLSILTHFGSFFPPLLSFSTFLHHDVMLNTFLFLLLLSSVFLDLKNTAIGDGR